MGGRTTEAAHRRYPLRQAPVPPAVRDALYRSGAFGFRYFTMGDCVILVARKPLGEDGALEWHLSISCQDRYPTWDEISDAREKLLPADEAFGFVLPRRDRYVNEHEFCFHLHRLPEGFDR